MSRTIPENIINEIIRIYPDSYAADVAKKLGISTCSVYYVANRYGIKKSPDFLKMELGKQGHRLKKDGANFRFKKGSIPVNKGKKVAPEIYEAMKPTMFKKGHTPHNTNFDGHERVDTGGYVYVRLRKGKYVLKHRKVWEEVNGNIPDGYAIVFKDGNRLNTDIENLELVKREELMQRNSIHRFPQELVSTIRVLGKLKKAINEKQD